MFRKLCFALVLSLALGEGAYALSSPTTLNQSSAEAAQARAYYFVAEEAFENKKYKDAYASLKKAQQLRGEPDARMLALEVKILYAQKRYSDAKKKLDVFYELDKRSQKLEREMAPILISLDGKIEQERQRKIALERAAAEKKRKAIARAKAAEEKRQKRLAEERAAAERKRIAEEKKRLAEEKTIAEWRKLSERGNSAKIVWQKVFGGAYKDKVFDVVKAKDGGFVLVGQNQSTKQEFRAWAVKLDQNGQRVWEYIDRKKRSGATSIVRAFDGGYILGGWRAGEGWDEYVIKISEKGKRVWDRRPSSSAGDDVIKDISRVRLAGGKKGYAYTGSRLADGQRYPGISYTVINKKGKAIGYKRGVMDGGKAWAQGNKVIQLADGTPLVAGYTRARGNGKSDAFLIKLFEPILTTTSRWHYQYDGGKDMDFANDAVQLANGDILVIGENASQPDVRSRLWIRLLSPDLNTTRWQKMHGFRGRSVGRAIIPLPDGNFLIGGETDRRTAQDKKATGKKDVWLLKIDSEGEPIWDVLLPGPDDERLMGMTFLPDGHVVIAAERVISNSDTDSLLMKVKLPTFNASVQDAQKQVAN